MYNKNKNPKEKGMKVIVRENESIERALKRLRKKMKKDGKFDEFKKNRFYEKPSSIKRRKKKYAILKTKQEEEKKILKEKKNN